MRAGSFVLLFVMCGCGARAGLDVPPVEARPDAGFDAAPEDASLDAGFDAAPEDASLDARTCVESSFPVVDTCLLSARNAAVRGRTPLGEVDFQYAWAGHLAGCGGSTLELSETPGLTGTLPRPPMPSLSVNVGDAVGDVEVGVTLRAPGCETITTTGRMLVRVNHGTPGDDPRGDARGDGGFCRCDGVDLSGLECPALWPQLVEGVLTVEGDGWSLHGELRARQCHSMHAACI